MRFSVCAVSKLSFTLEIPITGSGVSGVVVPV
jgi:hypothetical protein